MSEMGTPGRPIKIVLGEDNQDLASLNERVLEAEGHSVQVTRDGASTIEAVRATDPDLVLLDVEMPRGDGVSVVRKLREDPATSDQAVVMLSSAEITGEQEETLRSLGVSDFLAKHRFSPRVLADWIRRWAMGKVRNFPLKGRRVG